MFSNFFKKYTFFSRGQSLIETIVACGVMVMGITAILTLALASLTLSGMSKEKIVALNLAREGIEIVRGVRDSNWLDDIECWDWEEEGACGLKNGSWAVDYNTLELNDGTGLRFLSLNEYGLYQSSDTGTYERVITISEGDGEEEKKIVSKVTWEERRRVHSVELEARLTNWR